MKVVRQTILVILLIVMSRSSYGQPVARFTASPNPSACRQSVYFNGSSSYHQTPGRSIVAWEWDFDYDGIDFDVDASGVERTHPFDAYGSYTVALRVTDDDSPAVQDTDTIVIDVSLGNHPPIADAGGPYTIEEGEALRLDGTGSSEPDAGCGDSIVQYEWDLDNDGMFDDATGPTPVIPWSTVESWGLPLDTPHTIRLRATDTFGAMNTNQSTLTITRGAQIIHVDDDATGANDGSSWSDAFNDLQDALDATSSGDQIWVAAGTYYPTSDYGLGIGNRGKHFRMKNGVAIYGGFPDTGDPNMSDRDPNVYVSILNADTTGGSPSDSCYHAFYHPSGTSLNDTAVLDGFTITAGNANHAPGHDYGAGMLNDGSSPSITNCRFVGNTAVYGGGIFNYRSRPTITNCTFSGNIADYGGGIRNTDNSSPIISGCTFSGNSADYGGGIFNNQYSRPTVVGCAFRGNAADDGGGIYDDDNSSPTLSDCSFNGNTAVNIGGAMRNSNRSSPEVINCSFNNNSARYGGGIFNNQYSDMRAINCAFNGNSGDNGGGIYNDNHSNATIGNCTFHGNSASSNGGGLHNWDSNPRVTNCIFWDNTAQIGPQIHNVGSSPQITYCDVQDVYAGLGNIDEDPLFVDGYGPDNQAGTEDDDLHLQYYSPCIDKGDPAGDYRGQEDMDGEERVMYDNVDMGADEVFPIAGDINKDGRVDMTDFGFFASHWLKGTP